MGPQSRVRAAKCQMLVTSFFILLLGLFVATTALLTRFGAHFAVVGRASPQGSPYEALHHWALCAGISLAVLLTLGAVLSAIATVKEAEGLMAGGFLCFVLVFCALVQVAVWRFHNPSQVEDAVLDVYDLVYDQVVKGYSGTRRQELVAIQDTDCLQAIRSFLRTHRHITSALTGAGLASMVYATLLSSFLWFAIRAGHGLHRKGTYGLSPRARGSRPQEPSFFRRIKETHAPPPPSEADAHPGPSRHLGGHWLLQDS